MYPVPPAVWAVIGALLIGIQQIYGDWTGLEGILGLVTALLLPSWCACFAASALFGIVAIWFLTGVLKNTLKLLLLYHGWMYEPLGKPSGKTKLWFVSTRSTVSNWSVGD